MKDDATKQKFIELRASGLSLSKISRELSTSKPTLVSRTKELRLEIENQKALALDELRERLSLSRQKRLSLIGELLNKLKKDALGRDFSEMPDHKLLELAIKYAQTIEGVMPEIEWQRREKRKPLNELVQELDSGETVASWKL